MADKTTKQVKDHAVIYTAAVGVLGALTALTAFCISVTSGTAQNWARLGALVLGLLTAYVGFLKFRNERAFKQQQEQEKTSLSAALKAEARRTMLLVNGAMLGTAVQLRELAVADQPTKDQLIGALRSSIVCKVCDLVQSDAPRAGYFRVDDLTAATRVMRAGAYVHSRNREDSFTTEFIEGQAHPDQAVWNLIDSGDVFESNDTQQRVPDTWNTNANRQYRSFVSVAVRADGLAFGMLTANTMEIDGFTDSDIGTMQVLAHLLATAEATALSTSKINKIRSELASR
ncbi:hypothetical protein CYJ73_25020 [Gordonia terrae]|uniref:GAF domain-containing protein n=1 Tax=Gordonia terrae TaxID=2055 RepID=A0A2I1R150_9ACTN|nr:GAF domain-containing protein [Gordonia terrae]PKZ62839.1 hypothetical protein CYJ73_25020 [Gordonia terrae]